MAGLLQVLQMWKHAKFIGTWSSDGAACSTTKPTMPSKPDLAKPKPFVMSDSENSDDERLVNRKRSSTETETRQKKRVQHKKAKTDSEGDETTEPGTTTEEEEEEEEEKEEEEEEEEEEKKKEKDEDEDEDEDEEETENEIQEEVEEEGDSKIRSRTKFRMDTNCLTSGFVCAGKAIANIKSYIRFHGRAKPTNAEIACGFMGTKRCDEFYLKDDDPIPFKAAIKSPRCRKTKEMFGNVWVHVTLVNGVNQLRPLFDLRRFNVDREVLFDFTMIRFIVWDVLAGHNVVSERTIRERTKQVTRWYAACAGEPRLCKLQFPWNDNMTGKLEAPANYNIMRYNNSSEEDSTQKLNEVEPMSSQETFSQETRQNEEDDCQLVLVSSQGTEVASDDDDSGINIMDEVPVSLPKVSAWQYVPKCVQELFPDKQKLYKVPMSNALRNALSTDMLKPSIETLVDAPMTLFFDAQKKDWAIIVRVGGVYEDRNVDFNKRIHAISVCFFVNFSVCCCVFYI